MNHDGFQVSAFNPSALQSGFMSSFLPPGAGGSALLVDENVTAGHMDAHPISFTGQVIHVADRLTDDMLAFLRPAIEALAEAGIEQTLLAVDSARSRRVLQGAPDTLQIMLTRDSRNAVKRWNASLGQFRAALASGPVRSIHLHGLVPGMLAPFVIRAMNVNVPAFYSAHGAGDVQARRIGSSRISGKVEQFGQIDHPVDDAFFGGSRFDLPRPVIVTSNAMDDERASSGFARQIAQMAVLLFDEDPAPAFAWIGKAGAHAMKRLKAARIEVVNLPNVYDRAIRLSSATIYVALGSEPGFPMALAEAMASGLPCVAIDTAHHRRLLRHGSTGFVCRSFEDLLEHVARLLHSPELRAAVGEAARAEARMRFTSAVFQQSLLAAYEISVNQPKLSS